MEKSLRQSRKAARGNTPSRPVRRAADRLKSAMAGFEAACKASGKGGSAAYTKPGSLKHW